MTYTDEQLKRGIAVALTNKVSIILDQDGDTMFWKDGSSRSDHWTGKTGTQLPIMETEMLGLCHMIEQEKFFGPFNRHLRIQYKQVLHTLNRGCTWSASWQIRAEALITVLGIKL